MKPPKNHRGSIIKQNTGFYGAYCPGSVIIWQRLNRPRISPLFASYGIFLNALCQCSVNILNFIYMKVLMEICNIRWLGHGPEIGGLFLFWWGGMLALEEKKRPLKRSR